MSRRAVVQVVSGLLLQAEERPVAARCSAKYVKLDPACTLVVDDTFVPPSGRRLQALEYTPEQPVNSRDRDAGYTRNAYGRDPVRTFTLSALA